jgi:hypothetical protein
MSVLRESARGRECQVRIPGYCNHDNDTVVLAHMNGGGLALKNPDLFGSFACSSCHDALDGRVRVHAHDAVNVKLMFMEGIIRTQRIWLEEELINYGSHT